MPLKILLRKLKANIAVPRTESAILILALTQVPVAVKTLAEIACIGEVSNKIWKQTQSHKQVNTTAVHICNGGNR